jgi:Ser/Thr protein kinase RdoA (MazF antagonist)
LRQFHDATVVGDQPHHHNAYLQELDSNLYRSRQLGLTSSALQKIRDGVEATSATLNGTDVPTAAAHGDFLPQNILIREGGAGVVDFGSYWHQAPIYRDLSHLISYLALLANRPAYDRRALESLKSGFLRGYCRALTADLLRIYEVNATLRIINDRSSVVTAHVSRKIEHLLLSLAAVAAPAPENI